MKKKFLLQFLKKWMKFFFFLNTKNVDKFLMDLEDFRFIIDALINIIFIPTCDFSSKIAAASFNLTLLQS